MVTKQKATINIRIYPKTHKRLRIKSAKLGISLALATDIVSLENRIQDQVEELQKKGIKLP